MTVLEMLNAVNARTVEINIGLAKLDDTIALTAPELFMAWAAGVDYKKDFRFRFGEKLYKVLQDHTSQADWLPDITPSLYAEVEKPGQGDTPDNPIPYNGNMELLENKYYSEDGVTYRCFRGTGIPVHNRLADLVSIYVEVVK